MRPHVEIRAVKQVVQAVKGGRTRVADVAAPTLRTGSVLVRTRWSLISAGTEKLIIDLAGKSLLGKARARPDLVKKTIEKVKREGVVATYRAVSGRLSGDVPLGYSASGEVLAVGAGVVGLAPGDRVACAGAGYANHAEILCVPRNLCARVPEGVELKDACAATLGAIALHGVRTADARLGETVVVVGLGLLGQLAAQMLRASGARVVAVDRDGGRAALAKRLGADVAIGGDENPAPAVMGLTNGQGADVAIVCAGSDSSEPVALAASLCRRRGVVVVVGAVGMDLDRRTFYERELSLRMSTSYGPGRYDPVYEERGLDYPYAYVRWTEGRNLDAFLDLVAKGSVNLAPLATHEFAIDDAEAAYELVTGEKREPFLGILLRYDGDARAPQRWAPPPRAAARAGGVRVGLVGAGAFATGVLLPALKSCPGVRLTAVSTAGGATADAVKRNFAFDRVAADADDVVGADDVDAIVVATRHDSHARLVALALAAGKPCFVEKPLAIRPEELAEVFDAMSTTPGVVCVGFNRRFAPAVVALKKALAARTSPLHARYRVNAGAIPAAHWTRDPDVGGGRIVGEACHFVDLVAFVADSTIVRVTADRVGDDGAAAMLRFADGSTATVEYLTAGDPSIPKEHLEVHWEGTSYVLDDFRSLARHADSRRRELWSGSQDKGHAAEVAAFVRAVALGESSPVPFDEAVAATEATFAILDSIATGAAVDLTE